MTTIPTYDRAEHQPVAIEPPHPEPTQKQLRRACANTVALILAWTSATTPLKVIFEDPETEPVTCGEDGKTLRPLQKYDDVPLVVHALHCACNSQVRRVRVLVSDKEVEQAILDEVQAMDDAKVDHPMIDCVTVYAADIEKARKSAGGAQLFEVPAAAFLQGQDLLAQESDASALLFMSCDQVRITPRHVLALHERMSEKPGTDVVTTWAQWTRSTPLLVTRALVESSRWNKAASILAPSSVSRLPIPHLEVEEVVFGEEKLIANATAPDTYTEFSQACTISALEAVRLAHEKAQDKAAADDEKDDKDALDGVSKNNTGNKDPNKANPIKSDADRLLVELADEVIADLDAALNADADFAAHLEQADSWGRRMKHAFPIFSDHRLKNRLVYLDSSATSQRLGCALDAQSHFDTSENANIYRGLYELSAESTALYNESRAIIEDFINADRRQTIITENTTTGCNLVAQAWGDHNISEGDLIAVCISEHHSNLMPWMLLARRKGAQVVYIPLDDDGRIDQEAYDEILARKPKLVCVAHVSNVLGMINPVESMIERAHKVGARFMLDVAQSIPHIALDVKKLNADFVAFSGHKMYGPLGVGGLWVSPEAFDEMDPEASGGGAISHVGKYTYYLRLGAVQYEIGTPPIAQTVGFATALEYLNEVGMDEVATHDEMLVKYLMMGLRDLENVIVWGDHESNDGEIGLVALSVANMESAQVGKLFGCIDVAVRSGGHCALPLSAYMGVTGTTRLSFGIHTTREDIEAAIVALRLCDKLFNERTLYGQGDKKASKKGKQKAKSQKPQKKSNSQTTGKSKKARA